LAGSHEQAANRRQCRKKTLQWRKCLTAEDGDVVEFDNEAADGSDMLKEQSKPTVIGMQRRSRSGFPFAQA
jgi:hypothetical protein